MKKLSNNYVKAILGVALVSLIAVLIIGYNKPVSLDGDTEALGFAENSVADAEKEAKEALDKASVATKELEEAEAKVNEALLEEKRVEAKVEEVKQTAVKGLEAAKEELQAAKTLEEENAAKEKVKAAEAELKKAEEEAEAAKEKAAAARKQAEEEASRKEAEAARALAAQKEAEAKAEEARKKAEEEAKKAEEAAKFQRMLELAQKGEERDKQAFEDAMAKKNAEVEAKRAERLANEQAQKEAEEAEAKARAERESTAGLKEKEQAKNTEVLPEQKFESPKLSDAASKADSTITVNTKENGQEITCAADHCDDYGWIWFAKFQSEYPIFADYGFGPLVKETFVGRRGGANTSWMQYVPSVVNGHKFKGWVITTDTIFGIRMNVYTAVYE